MERRPLKSRSTSWARFFSRWLLEKKVQPDHISLTGIVFALLSGVSFLLASFEGGNILYFLAGVFIQLRLLCNMLDGMVALEGGLKSKFGDLYNELPDRIEDLVILVCAGYGIRAVACGNVLGWAAAVMAVLTAYIRAFGGAIGTKQYFQGPMAKPQRMAVLTIACVLEAVFLRQGLFLALALCVVILGGVITCVRRVGFIVRELNSR